ncbi:Peptidase C45, acyl-coenzyme A:6-aminopenicillanic acid acyl-transferase [Candidatus Sulfopaludibacter sp. SbA4]|nr:Peptidase C45, acyl-coenzyme A:6-aminopenicillanic acid acyl-transferase [Candidatus Sulfopaludibacter sp. SbA4]
MRRTSVFFSAVLLLGLAFTLVSREPAPNPRLRKAYRLPERNGWIQVHLEGSPADIGFQHGYLLTAEIKDDFKAISTELSHDEKKDWEFFRKTAREVFWPHIEQEYRDELTGIVDGLNAHGVRMDVWDIVAMNAWLELPYYDKFLTKGVPTATGGAGPGDHCSAFVATGSYTKDGRIVIGHNNWTSYSSGERWNIMFDIVPAQGSRILMDGPAGLIHSADDFGVNQAGIVITETTISGFSGFDPDAVPEFVRARKAMQYAASIDDFARIMKDGNNGGYANTWLVADRKTNEIASLELGLKNVTLLRTKDGFYVGSNFPADPKLVKEETDFDVNDKSKSENARHARWLALMDQYRGKIDVAAGQKFLADHYDSYEGKIDPSERTLCGHIEVSPRGMGTWQAPYAPAGAVQNKVTDAAGAEKMSLTAALGHSCGISYKSAEHMAKHPEFAWMRDILHDMPARGWARFTAR